MTVQARHMLFKAPDISCEHCKRAIESAVGALDGIERVVVDVAEKTVDVISSPNVSAADVRVAIEAAGYPVAEERELD